VGYLMLAEAQLGQGQFAEAAETYNQLEKVNALGTSKAAAGLADLALYQGRFKDAARMLEQGATSDLVAKRPEAAANKLVALAYTELSRQQVRPAVAAAKKALDANSQSVGIRFMAARIFVEAGEFAKAQKLAVGLDSELQTEPQAYAKIIQGKLALKRGDTREAIQSLTEATKLLDTWIGRFELGRAYLQANAFVEADSEFDSCTRRQGEALELFMDDNPTFGYFPAVYYYQGRAGEGLKNSNYRDSYRAYLNIREKAGEDPLLNEVKTRAAQLTASK
jgi:lipopolysaccharide biosynthesis regulator YciM